MAARFLFFPFFSLPKRAALSSWASARDAREAKDLLFFDVATEIVRDYGAEKQVLRIW